VALEGAHGALTEGDDTKLLAALTALIEAASQLGHALAAGSWPPNPSV